MRPRGARGAVTAIAVLVLLMIVAVAMLILSGMLRSSVSDSVIEDDSVAALFLAESGLERAARVFAASGSCANVGAGLFPFGRGSFEVSSLGAAGLSPTQCRIRAIGRVTNTAIERTVDKVVDRSLVVNGDFETPGGCPPAAWTLTDDYGGPNCRTVGGDTQVLVNKTSNGGNATTVAAQTLAMPVTTAAAVTAAIQYNYAVEPSAGSGSVRYTVQLNYSDGSSDRDRKSFRPGESGTYQASIAVPANKTIVSVEVELRATGSPKRGLFDDFFLTVPGYARPVAWIEAEL